MINYISNVYFIFIKQYIQNIKQNNIIKNTIIRIYIVEKKYIYLIIFIILNIKLYILILDFILKDIIQKNVFKCKYIVVLYIF